MLSRSSSACAVAAGAAAVRANNATSRVMDVRINERMGHLLPGMVADPEAPEKGCVEMVGA
jgi:hypothetical protein